MLNVPIWTHWSRSLTPPFFYFHSCLFFFLLLLFLALRVFMRKVSLGYVPETERGDKIFCRGEWKFVGRKTFLLHLLRRCEYIRPYYYGNLNNGVQIQSKRWLPVQIPQAATNRPSVRLLCISVWCCSCCTHCFAPKHYSVNQSQWNKHTNAHTFHEETLSCGLSDAFNLDPRD